MDSVRFERDGTKVVLRIDTGRYSVERRIMPFEHNVAEKLYASIICESLVKELHALVSDIRRKAYRRGYKDGKGKQRQRIVFCGELRRDGC